jgi:hypothetical protein
MLFLLAYNIVFFCVQLTWWLNKHNGQERNRKSMFEDADGRLFIAACSTWWTVWMFAFQTLVKITMHERIKQCTCTSRSLSRSLISLLIASIKFHCFICHEVLNCGRDWMWWSNFISQIGTSHWPNVFQTLDWWCYKRMKQCEAVKSGMASNKPRFGLTWWN